MFHFVYKTVNSKGDYYIGRHSTKKLTDNYQGSGNWIKHSKNKNSHLITGIIDFSYSFDTVKILEESIIYYHLKVLKDKKCKNQSLSSSGFSVGDLNPANRPEQRERSRKNAWFSTEAGKEWIKNNHSTDNPENKKLFSENAKKQWENEEYKSYMRKCVSIANAKPENKKRMIENNPAKTEQARKKISISSPCDSFSFLLQ